MNGSGYGEFHAEIQDTSTTCDAILTFTADKTQKYYLYVDCTYGESISVQKSGGDDIIYIDEDYPGVENIGVVEKGENVTVDVTFESGNSGDITAYIYYLDQAKWDGAYSMLSKNTLDITEFKDTHFKGTIDAGEGGVMVTSIPYDKGWKLYVDGKRRSTSNLTADCLISTQLTAGVHEIEMKFMPQGFIPGIILTILSILLLIGIRIYDGSFRRRLSKSAAPEPDETGNDSIDVG